jgi:signal transduction histidine kinase
VHAFRDKPSGAHVALLVERDEDTLIIHVRDNGSGFAPRTDSPGLGIGIPTIAALTSSMSVGTSPIGGTELCMEFSR